MNTAKKWSIGFLALTLAMMAAFGGLTAVVDPYFHYHKPLNGLEYPIYEERYQNDGIVKNFDYDALITGTSMTKNFRTSLMDELFGVSAVKVPLSGSTYKEVDANLRRGIAANPELRMVVRSLDGYLLYEEKDTMRTDEVFPDYLYDSSLFNDTQYVLNKSIFLKGTMRVLEYTRQGNITTSFDNYADTITEADIGPASVLRKLDWNPLDWSAVQENQSISPEMKTIVLENMLQNVIALVEENPDIQFYFYYPPYSIAWWAKNYRSGTLLAQVDCYRIATEMLLEHENVRLFAFENDYDLITDLNNYVDYIHYVPAICDRILMDMHQGDFELTRENAQSHWDAVQSYYMAFDYEGYFHNLIANMAS